jgi:hypothetical protein
VIDPNDAPDPAETAPDTPLDETTPPVDENFSIDQS